MIQQKQFVGFYGKLPANGDFIQRNLPASFINVWDEWLQYYIASSKEKLGEQWLDIYLTSPVWRFVFSEGVIDSYRWAGILIPSVDRVGRYFPFSIASKLQSNINPLEFLVSQDDWYAKVTEECLASLAGTLSVDDLFEKVNAVPLNNGMHFRRVLTSSEHQANFMMKMRDIETHDPATAFSPLLDSVLMKTYASYSAWATTGSQIVPPCLLTTQGLPSIAQLPAMLSGQWQAYAWHEPQPFSI